MTSPKLRLFVAASVPRTQLDVVAAATGDLRDRWDGAKWIPADNQHVTLKFLGSVPSEELDAVSQRCLGVAREVEPASLRLAQLGAFPSIRRARVLWIGLEDPAGALTRLAGLLDDALEPLGFPVEKRLYTAHLTLARFKTPRALGELPHVVTPEPFTLDRYGLWRSHLSPRGARYERVGVFGLGVDDSS